MTRLTLKSRVERLAFLAFPVAMILTPLALAVASERTRRPPPDPSRTMSVERVVPDGAVLQYLVGGRVVQSQTLQAGTYRVTVERIR